MNVLVEACNLEAHSKFCYSFVCVVSSSHFSFLEQRQLYTTFGTIQSHSWPLLRRNLLFLKTTPNRTENRLYKIFIGLLCRRAAVPTLRFVDTQYSNSLPAHTHRRTYQHSSVYCEPGASASILRIPSHRCLRWYLACMSLYSNIKKWDYGHISIIRI